MPHIPTINLDSFGVKRLFQTLNYTASLPFLTTAERCAEAGFRSKPDSIGDAHADNPQPKIPGLELWYRYRRVDLNWELLESLGVGRPDTNMARLVGNDRI